MTMDDERKATKLKLNEWMNERTAERNGTKGRNKNKMPTMKWKEIETEIFMRYVNTVCRTRTSQNKALKREMSRHTSFA